MWNWFSPRIIFWMQMHIMLFTKDWQPPMFTLCCHRWWMALSTISTTRAHSWYTRTPSLLRCGHCYWTRIGCTTGPTNIHTNRTLSTNCSRSEEEWLWSLCQAPARSCTDWTDPRKWSDWRPVQGDRSGQNVQSGEDRSQSSWGNRN